jgi:hypothetical protein
VTPEQFLKYSHDATHELMRLNEKCDHEFHILSWPRYDYDLKDATLIFSKDGVPGVITSIQVVGTTSESEGTWLWSWANDSLPSDVTEEMKTVRAFGESENVRELTEPRVADDEYKGWEMTAIATKLIGGKGAYRCPSNDGFIYFVYTDLAFAEVPLNSDRKQIQCSTHETGYETYICEHLLAEPKQEWFSDSPTEVNQWPDAWCAKCDAAFQEEGAWNERNKSRLKINLVCHHCYKQLRSEELITEDSH